ncbi:MAG TPA: type II and III secretion system protein [Terriglobales bacterium]|nr:type II and III secretion system protein [Terriglobales bacterium]
MVWLFVGVCLAADTPTAAAPPLCSNSGSATTCHGSAKELKDARQAFARGLKLEKSSKENPRNLNEALNEFEEAIRLVPQNVEYLTARELIRQNLAAQYLERGNSDLLAGKQEQALSEFRAALNFDPQNEFVQQRISDALGPAPINISGRPRVVESVDQIASKPLDGHHDIHYRGDSRGLLTAVATSYGLTVIFDETIPTRHVLFDLDDADFATAMQAASAATKTFVVSLEDTVLFAAVDNLENHRLYDRMGLRTFYIPTSGAPQDLQEITNSLRMIFEFKFVNQNVSSSTVTVRGPQPALEAATQFLGQLHDERPEVMLDLKVFQVSHSYMTNIGLHVPDTFNLYNIPVAALTALGGQSIQQLIQEIAAGGTNPALLALLTQLESQASSLFAQPLATFGGGLTFMGLSLDQLSPVLALNESSVRQIDHVQLRASQQKDATFKLGERYPIINASYSAGLSSAALQALGSQASSIALIPSFTYEDIGLTLKAKPLIHNNSDVALDLEIQIQSLGTTVTNGVPDILNRQYKGGILVKNGEQALVAGMITQSDEKTLNGLPLFSTIPGLGYLTSQQGKQEEDDELLILITPHVTSSPEQTEAPEIWLK